MLGRVIRGIVIVTIVKYVVGTKVFNDCERELARRADDLARKIKEG